MGGARAGRSRAASASLATVVAPPGTHFGRTGDMAALVVYAGPTIPVRASDAALLLVFSTAVPSISRTIAWTFTLFGHPFYVLDLGNQGTFLYDISTQSWSEWQTQGNAGWNVRGGTMYWDGDVPLIVGGDSSGPYVWQLNPNKLFDEGFRDIAHAATAGIMLRSRVYKSMSELRIAASAGLLDDTQGAAYIQLTWSDDGGQTYQGPVIVPLVVGTTPDGQQDIRFSSLGAFMAPGRVLQIADVGGVLRLDGVDAMIDSYDESAEEPQAQ